MHLFSKTGCAQDDFCPFSRYLYSIYGGKGIEPTEPNLDYELGILAHGAGAGLVNGDAPLKWAKEARATMLDVFSRKDLTKLLPEEQETLLIDLQNLAEGFVWAINRRVLPRLREEYLVVSVEREFIRKINERIGARSTPDLLLRPLDPSIPGLTYFEVKSTGSTSPNWFAQFQRNPQSWLGALCAKEELGEDVTAFLVQGLYKGAVRDGRRSSPFCYGWKKHDVVDEPNPAWFVREGVTFSYVYCARKGWERFPVHEFPEGIQGWVERMPFEVLDEQLPTTLPITIDEELMEVWLAERVIREEQIAEARKALEDGIAWDLERKLMATVFPHHFGNCDPPIGHGCQYKDFCHNPVIAADPIASGKFRLRVDRREKEKEAA
jgi:hypothetical protein